MSEHCGQVTHHIKRRGKIHLCAWCGEAIAVGDKYAKWLYFDSGERDTVYAHDECAEVWIQEANKYGEVIYADGDQHRPQTLQPTDKGVRKEAGNE